MVSLLLGSLVTTSGRAKSCHKRLVHEPADLPWQVDTIEAERRQAKTGPERAAPSMSLSSFSAPYDWQHAKLEMLHCTSSASMSTSSATSDAPPA